MSYDHGRFVWFEIITPNAADAQRFYTEVFGWKVSPMEMGNGMTYPILQVGETGFGGVVPPQKAGVAPHWISYLSVPDVDGAAEAVTRHGGRAMGDAFDVAGVGRMQPVADPQGAPFFLFHAAAGDPSPTEGVGAYHWNELTSSDPSAAVSFYEAAFGFTHESMDMPMGRYHVLSQGGAARAGVMAPVAADAPPGWLQYFVVDDVDAAVARASRNGGSSLGGAADVPNVGRVAVIADADGARIGLITPAA